MENATKTVGIMETGKEPGESVSREDGTQKNVYGQASLKVVCVCVEGGGGVIGFFLNVLSLMIKPSVSKFTSVQKMCVRL